MKLLEGGMVDYFAKNNQDETAVIIRKYGVGIQNSKSYELEVIKHFSKSLHH